MFRQAQGAALEILVFVPELTQSFFCVKFIGIDSKNLIRSMSRSLYVATTSFFNVAQRLVGSKELFFSFPLHRTLDSINTGF